MLNNGEQLIGMLCWMVLNMHECLRWHGVELVSIVDQVVPSC
jgi:hypothetical protein